MRGRPALAQLSSTAPEVHGHARNSKGPGRGATHRHGHAAGHHRGVHAHRARALRGSRHAAGGWGPVEATLRGEGCSLGEHAGHGGLWGPSGGLHGLQLGHALRVLLLQLLLPHLQQGHLAW